MPISFDRVLGETSWAVFFWNHILNLGLGAGLGWAGWRGWAKTLVGSLRAFPRLVETPRRDRRPRSRTGDGFAWMKPRRTPCNMLTSILAILSFTDTGVSFSASPSWASDSGFLVCTAAVLLCLSGSPSRYAYMRLVHLRSHHVHVSLSCKIPLLVFPSKASLGLRKRKRVVAAHIAASPHDSLLLECIAPWSTQPQLATPDFLLCPISVPLCLLDLEFPVLSFCSVCSLSLSLLLSLSLSLSSFMLVACHSVPACLL